MINKALKQSLTKSSWIRAMFEEGSRLKKIYGAENVFDFSIGNPDTEPPQEVQNAFIKCAGTNRRGTHGYMNNAGYETLRQKIADTTSKKSGIDILPSNIIVTCGAAGGLNVALKTIIDPEDEVLILRPFFAEYIFYVQNCYGKPVFVDVDPDTFLPDLHSFKELITPKTKAVIINSPNNPSGVIYSEKILNKMADILSEKESEYAINIMVLSDEPYRELVYDDVILPDMLKIFKNVVSIYSYSKSLSLPGERIGYILASPSLNGLSEFLEGAVFCNRTLGFVNAPAFIQHVLEESIGAMTNSDIYKERRDILYDNLTALGFSCQKPQGAFYLFPRSPIPDEVEFVRSALKYNLLLVPGRGFGLEGHFRIAYCVDKKTIQNSIPQFTRLAADYGLKKR